MAQLTDVAAFIVGAYVGYFFYYGLVRAPTEGVSRRIIMILAVIVAFFGWILGIITFIKILSDQSSFPTSPASAATLAGLLGALISAVFAIIQGVQDSDKQEQEAAKKNSDEEKKQ